MAKNKTIRLFALALFLTGTTLAIPPKIRRVCTNKTDNNIYFYPTTDSCTGPIAYYIWGNDGTGGPYVLIDSIVSKTASEYTHLNANPTGAPKKWIYFVETATPCPGSIIMSSDSIGFNDHGPDSTSIDSVSVDILTNKVNIGWPKNQSSNFYRYEVYKLNSSGTSFVSPSELRDTFLRDTLFDSKPEQGPLTYDMTAYDSCGVSQVFGYNIHTTINLNFSIDTCSSVVNLNWTRYIGWTTRKYYIFWSVNGGNYLLMDSVDGSITNYSRQIILGKTYSIFVRSYKLAPISFSSTSNLINFSTRLRKNPKNTYLANVTALDPDGSTLGITVFIRSDEEYSQIIPTYAQEPEYSPFINEASIPTAAADIVKNQSYVLNDRSKIRAYKVYGMNICGQLSDTSNVSNSMVLNASGNGTQNNLIWNSYKGWDNGVEKYRIFRGTNLNSSAIIYTLLDSVFGTDTQFLDSEPLEEIGNLGVCYYVEAVQNYLSPHNTKQQAKSFSSCVTGELLVFIPNAFCPNGYNKIFLPQGSCINYDLSTMEIYNRWGGLVFKSEGIANGWDGKDRSGAMSESGVYFYKINIISTNGQTKTKSGNVTLLN